MKIRKPDLLSHDLSNFVKQNTEPVTILYFIFNFRYKNAPVGENFGHIGLSKYSLDSIADMKSI